MCESDKILFIVRQENQDRNEVDEPRSDVDGLVFQRQQNCAICCNYICLNTFFLLRSCRKAEYFNKKLYFAC